LKTTKSEWKDTKVNFLKLIKDLRDQFPYDPLTALIVETFANSLDAKAKKIEIWVKSGGLYRIVDDGKGMSRNEFEDYHNIASLAKEKGSGIGFAGVGAKIYLDRAEYTITETKSAKFNGSSYWVFSETTPRWKEIPVRKRVPKTGTMIEVKIGDPSDRRRLSRQFVANTLRRHYNAVLLGYYRTRKVMINGRKVVPWKPSNVEIRKDLDFRYAGHRIRGFFIKSPKEIPDDFQGPHIVVHGKTIQQHWFKQYPIYPETFTGALMADHLISILTTSKAQFDYTSGYWRRFHAKMGKVLSDWLTEIDAKPKPPPVSSQLDDLARDLEKSINEVLKSPEFIDLARNIFQNIMRKTVAIPSTEGNLFGSEVDGVQKTKGKIAGIGGGEGVPTLGSEEGLGIVEDEGGKTAIEEVRRRVRGGIKIGFDDKPEILMESWIDPGQQVIVINTGYPAFKVACGMYAENYHMLRCVIETLLKEIELEEPAEQCASIYSKWFELQSK